MTGPNANFAFGMADLSGTYSKGMDSKNQEKEASSNIPFAELMGQSMGMVSANDRKLASDTNTNADTSSDLLDIANSVDANTNQLKIKLNKSSANDGQTGVQSVKNNSKVAKDTPSDASVKAASGAINQISENVSKEVAEELGITEEQLEVAMENLGLSFMDLINPQNLEALVSEISAQFGETIPELANIDASETVMNMMPQIDAVIGEALNENGISLEEFGDFFEAVSDGTVELPEEIQKLLPQTASAEGIDQTQFAGQPNGTSDLHPAPMKTETDASSLRGTTESAVCVIKLVDEDVIDEEGNINEDAIIEGEVIEDAALDMNADSQRSSGNESDNQNENAKNDAAFQSRQDVSTLANRSSHFEAAGSASNVGNVQVQSFEQTIAQVETVTSYTREQTTDIINQIITRASATITETVSRMEMELNPQSLGRMIMQVQQQEGTLVARLIAQNDNVKEALETQVAQLKASLEAKGIKVDAVEVSVGTHEFEQALEEGMSQAFEGEAEREEQNANSRPRNLNRGEIDDIADELTDEEALAAAIMRDNGGTVDYSA